MQNEFSPEQRATMKSIISCLSSIFIAFVLILMGWIADIYGARTAILIAILVKITVIISSLIILNKKEFDKLENEYLQNRTIIEPAQLLGKQQKNHPIRVV